MIVRKTQAGQTTTGERTSRLSYRDQRFSSTSPAHPRRAESRSHRSAGTRGARERAPCVGCSRLLDGPSNVPVPNENAPDGHDVSNNPQSGAMATDWPAPTTMIASTAVETGAMVEAPHPLSEGWAHRWMDPGPRVVPDATIVAPAARRCPRVLATAINIATCRKQPGCS